MAGNGQLDRSELAPIPGTTVLIRADLAPQLGAFRRAFAARFGKPLVITDGYRPLSGNFYAQTETFLRRYTTTYLPGRPTKRWNGVTYWQRPGTAMAATPGESTHGWGTAVDLGSGVNIKGSAEHQWAVANAPLFGLRWPVEWAASAGEFWHFEDGHVVPVSRYASVPGAVDITIPDLPVIDPITPKQEDEMLVIARTTNDAAVWIGNGVTRRHIATKETLAAIQWLAADERGILGPIYQAGAVQTIDDLWTLGHPIDASEQALEQRLTAAIAGVKGGTQALDPKATAAAIATALGTTLAGQVATELAKRLAQ